MTSPKKSTSPFAPATLNLPHRELHPDSEEFTDGERHRTANELEPLRLSDNPHSSQPQSRVLDTPLHSSASTFRTRNGASSEISTVQDSEGSGHGHATRYRLRRRRPRWYDPLGNLWTNQISITIDEGSHRDHLVALERTFLGYLRTSLMLSMTGVIIAQLFRLQHTVNPHPELGFYVLGTPLAAAFIAFGIIVLLIGAFRFWKQQNAMIRGKVYSGGWEVSAIMLLSILLFLAFFILVTAIDIDRSYDR